MSPAKQPLLIHSVPKCYVWSGPLCSERFPPFSALSTRTAQCWVLWFGCRPRSLVLLWEDKPRRGRLRRKSDANRHGKRQVGLPLYKGHKLWVCFMTVSAFGISSPLWPFQELCQPPASSLHLLSLVHLFCGQRMAVQIVDNSVRMTFHGDQEPHPISSQKRLRFIKANFYEGCAIVSVVWGNRCIRERQDRKQNADHQILQIGSGSKNHYER